MVEAILGARSVSKTTTVIVNGGRAKTINEERPMRFVEFSAEVGLDNARAYRYIRGGIVPETKTHQKIFAWCKKHFAAIKTK